MTQLIVSANGFGLTQGINRGIVAAHEHGIVTSTSLIATGPEFQHAVRMARQARTLDVGAQFVLWNKPGIPRRRLTMWRHAAGQSVEKIEGIFERQLDKVSAAGISPTHVTTFGHIHTLPHVLLALETVARRAGIRWVRRPLIHWWSSGAGVLRTDRITGLLLGPGMSRFWLAGEIEKLRPGLTELIVHPGKYDAALSRLPVRLKDGRERHLKALIAPEIRALLCLKGIHLTSYRECLAALRKKELGDAQLCEPEILVCL